MKTLSIPESVVIFARNYFPAMKKILDILAIVLPALIILLGIIRLFVQKTRGVNGLTMISAILLLLIGLIRFFVFGSGGGGSSNNGPKPPPLTVSKHSEAFNISLEKVLNSYIKMTGGFATNNVNEINQWGNELKTALDSFKIDELKADTLIYQTALQPYGNAKAELNSILFDPSISEKRSSFNIFSNELFALISTARYDITRLYWLECGKAFGEDKPGNWLSKTEAAPNPYGQQECTELKDKIDHVPADTTQKSVPEQTKN